MTGLRVASNVLLRQPYNFMSLIDSLSIVKASKRSKHLKLYRSERTDNDC